jgi:hypothetical protein
MQIRYSSAEYPQSNGATESAVKLLKQLQKVSATEHELFRALLYLQGQAKRRHTASPAQIFLGRSVQTPLVPRVEQSTVDWSKNLMERQQDQQRTMKSYFDRTASQVAQGFVEGDKVLVHNVQGSSAPGIVVRATDNRAYQVEFPNRSRSVRNRRFLTFIPRDTATDDMCPVVYQPRMEPVATSRTGPAAAAATRDDATRTLASIPAVSGNDSARTGTPMQQAERLAIGTEVPRPNPCSPPRPVITTTRSGCPIVPTLKGMGR